MTAQRDEPEEPLMRDRLAVTRTRLANERTLLAYVRTAIMLAATGVTALKLYAHEMLMFSLGWALIAAAVAVGAIGARKYLKLSRLMD